MVESFLYYFNNFIEGVLIFISTLFPSIENFLGDYPNIINTLSTLATLAAVLLSLHLTVNRDKLKIKFILFKDGYRIRSYITNLGNSLVYVKPDIFLEYRKSLFSPKKLRIGISSDLRHEEPIKPGETKFFMHSDNSESFLSNTVHKTAKSGLLRKFIFKFCLFDVYIKTLDNRKIKGKIDKDLKDSIKEFNLDFFLKEHEQLQKEIASKKDRNI